MFILQNLLKSGSATAPTTGSALYTWGYNPKGNLGIGLTTNRSSPVAIGTRSWTQIEIGTWHTLAIDSDYKLWAWGSNQSKALGNDAGAIPVNRSSPIAVSGAGSTSSWISIGVYRGTTEGYAWSTGITTDGKLYTWGSNYFWQLGTGDRNFGRSRPFQIAVGTSFTKVAAGNSHGLAISTTGALWAWGINDCGQIGGNDSTIRVGVGVKSISIGSESGALATQAFVDTNGTLYAWGFNNVGQLGIGDTIRRSSPVVVDHPNFEAWDKVFCGQSNMFAIDSLGNLWGWGSNVSGQLGINNAITRSRPVNIPGSWIQVATPTNLTTLALRSDRTLWAWGTNISGLLGINAALSFNRSSPIAVGTSSWTMVVGRIANAAAIDVNGRLFVWGNNTYGQLGNSSTIDRSSPIQVTGSWTSVAVGLYHMIGLSNNTVAYTWGRNDVGQLGNGTTQNRSSPNLTASPRGNITAVAAGIGISFLYTYGYIYSFGNGNSGGLGVGTNLQRSNPTIVSSLVGNSNQTIVESMAAGFNQAFFLTKGGVLYQTGPQQPDYINRSAPVIVGPEPSLVDPYCQSAPIQIGSSSWSLISAGNRYSIGVTTDNRIFAWGENSLQQLGDGTTTARSSPVQIYSVAGKNISQVSGGYNHSLALSTDGTMLAWGDPTTISLTAGSLGWDNLVFNVGSNGSAVVGVRSDGSVFGWGGGLGNSNSDKFGLLSTILRSTPIAIRSASFKSVLGLSSNSGGFINSNGALFIWGGGTGFYDSSGDGTTIAKSSPIQIGTSSWSQVAANGYCYAAIDTTGRLFTWGYNIDGALGINTNTNRSSPVQVGTSSWTQVVGGERYFLAIDAIGRLFSWGFNNFGQLGNNSTISRSSPILIAAGGALSWLSCYGFLATSYAIKSDNTLWSWGLNELGKFGNGLTTNRSSPVQVTGSWSAIGGPIGIKTDGTLWSWAGGTSGAVGDNTTISKSSPVQIGSETNWTKVGSGTTGGTTNVNISKFAINSSKQAYVWGNNTNGVLGLNDTINRSSPVLLTSAIYNALEIDTEVPFPVVGQSWSMIAAGVNQNAAIGSNNKLYTWGYNIAGAIGQLDNPTVVRSSPTQLGTKNYKWIRTGFDNMGAIGDA